MVWYGMVNVDLYSAIITKVSNVLNTLVSGEKPGFQALSKGGDWKRKYGKRQYRRMEYASTEYVSTNMQGWKIQVRKTQVRICNGGKRKYSN